VGVLGYGILNQKCFERRYGSIVNGAFAATKCKQKHDRRTFTHVSKGGLVVVCDFMIGETLFFKTFSRFTNVYRPESFCRPDCKYIAPALLS
jgi:hypothetical protein